MIHLCIRHLCKIICTLHPSSTHRVTTVKSKQLCGVSKCKKLQINRKRRQARSLPKQKSNILMFHLYLPDKRRLEAERNGNDDDCAEGQTAKKVIICMEERLLWESALINLKGGGRWQMTGMTDTVDGA